MPEKTSHTWRCPVCNKDEQHEADHTQPVPLFHTHPMFDGITKQLNDVQIPLEWVPPKDWVHVERIGWIAADALPR